MSESSSPPSQNDPPTAEGAGGPPASPIPNATPAPANGTAPTSNSGASEVTARSDSFNGLDRGAAVTGAMRDGVSAALANALRAARADAARQYAASGATRPTAATATATVPVAVTSSSQPQPVLPTPVPTDVAHSHAHSHAPPQQQQPPPPQPTPAQNDPAAETSPSAPPAAAATTPPPRPTPATTPTFRSTITHNGVSHSHVHSHGNAAANVNNNYNNNTARTVRRPNISVERNAQGARVARVDIGRGNVVTVPLQNNQNAVNVRVIQLEPLEPTPIQDNGSSQATDNDESLARFKCAICCEFMKEPVGCGKSNCSSRFCHVCLQRVIADANATARRSSPTNPANANNNHNNNNSNNNNPSPKCPTCRVEFNSMVVDQALKIEIYNGPTVPCRFEGCTQQLKLPLVGDHEKVCDHVQMKCRYASFGCNWTGKRGQLVAHERDDCAITRISGFVEQYRQVRGDHSSRLDMVQQQVVGSIRMNNVHRQNLQRDQMKTTSNLFDLMQYCHAITCTTPFFLFTKDKWASFFRSNETRAAVINFLVFLPTIVTCISTALNGYRIVFALMDQATFGTPPEGSTAGTAAASTNAQYHHQTLLLEEALICICIGALGVLILVGNFIDKKSSVKWGRFAIRHMEKPPIMCDVLAVAIFTIHLSIMEYHGADIKALLLWWCLAIASTFFPALVATLSHAASRNMTTAAAPTATNLMSQARSFEPFMFGLRYSVLATFVGMAPCFDASLFATMIPKRYLNTISKHLQMKSCFFVAVPKKFVLAYIGIKAAKICSTVAGYAYEEIALELIWWMVESGLAVLTFLALTVLLGCFLELGIAAGHRIITQAQPEVRPDGVQKDYNLFGMLCYGGWAGLLGLLVQFR